MLLLNALSCSMIWHNEKYYTGKWFYRVSLNLGLRDAISGLDWGYAFLQKHHITSHAQWHTTAIQALWEGEVGGLQVSAWPGHFRKTLSQTKN